MGLRDRTAPAALSAEVHVLAVRITKSTTMASLATATTICVSSTAAPTQSDYHNHQNGYLARPLVFSQAIHMMLASEIINLNHLIYTETPAYAFSLPSNVVQSYGLGFPSRVSTLSCIHEMGLCQFGTSFLCFESFNLCFKLRV